MASYRGRDLVDQAINAANRNGGLDNITVITVEIQQDTTQLTTQLTTSFSRTLGMVEKVDFLQDIFLFKHLTDQECIKLNRFLFESHYPSGAIIIEEGEPGDELFIVAQGQVAIYQGDTHLLNIGPGGHFGELAILRDDLRSATAVAEGDTSLFVITRQDFLDLLQSDQTMGNKVLWAFLENLAERVQDLSLRLSRK